MYSPFVDNVKVAVDAIEKRFAELQRKYNLLKHQYGVASRKIYELKCENAFLRAKLKEGSSDAINTVKINPDAVYGDYNLEPPHNLILRSSKPYWSENDPNQTFIIKYGQYSNLTYNHSQWWYISPNGENAWSDWGSWVLNYGPFTIVGINDDSN